MQNLCLFSIEPVSKIISICETNDLLSHSIIKGGGVCSFVCVHDLPRLFLKTFLGDNRYARYEGTWRWKISETISFSHM